MNATPRVVLTGTESTGKTTLAAEVAEHFECPWVPEYVRAYADRKSAPLVYEDVEPIARGQIEATDAVLRQSPRLLIQDTDLVSTMVYSRYYYGRCPAWVEGAARARRADLYLLLHPDVAWQPDPQRDLGGGRDAMHALFTAALHALGARTIDVRGSWDERRANAVGAIESLLSARER